MGQYGYVTATDAHELGIPMVELGKLAARGQIRHVAYGLYRFDDLPPTRYELIPSTTVAHAIHVCRDTLMLDRLLTAVGDARRDGLITAAEERQLRNGLRGNA